MNVTSLRLLKREQMKWLQTCESYLPLFHHGIRFRLIIFTVYEVHFNFTYNLFFPRHMKCFLSYKSFIFSYNFVSFYC